MIFLPLRLLFGNAVPEKQLPIPRRWQSRVIVCHLLDLTLPRVQAVAWIPLAGALLCNNAYVGNEVVVVFLFCAALVSYAIFFSFVCIVGIFTVSPACIYGHATRFLRRSLPAHRQICRLCVGNCRWVLAVSQDPASYHSLRRIWLNIAAVFYLFIYRVWLFPSRATCWTVVVSVHSKGYG